jgi:hypothetical protein
MGAVTIALMAFFAFLIARATQPQMVPLFTDLSVDDSSAIIKDLERQGMLYDIKNEGAIILVPKEQVPRLRMKRPAQGRWRRLRDLRQVRCARRHELRAEHQPPAGAGGRAGPHHPRHRADPAGSRASRRCSRATRPNLRPQSC